MLTALNIILAMFLTYIYHANHGFDVNFLGILLAILVFIIAFIAVFVVFFILIVIFIYATEKINPKSRIKHFVFHQYSVYIFRFFYRVKLVVTGKENIPAKGKTFVIVSNHIEYSDPIYILQAYKQHPIGFVAKEPLFRFPILRNLMYSMGCLPITRFVDRSALKTILKAINQVKDGLSMAIFPEGKRTYSNDLTDFKPGAFKLAQKPKADISPVCLYNMHALSKKHRFFPTKVYIHVLPIIKYEDYEALDSVRLASMVKEQIQEQMKKYKEN